jgi:hypothetical protein
MLAPDCHQCGSTIDLREVRLKVYGHGRFEKTTTTLCEQCHVRLLGKWKNLNGWRAYQGTSA